MLQRKQELNLHVFNVNKLKTLTKHTSWTVCSCHVTYVLQSESTFYSCLNVKELLAQSRREIWRWSDCRCLAKWLSVCLRTMWFWVRVQLQSLHTSWKCKCKFDDRKCKSNQKWNNDKFWCDCKYSKKMHVRKITFGLLLHVMKL